MPKTAFLGFSAGSLVDLTVSLTTGEAGSVRIPAWAGLVVPPAPGGSQDVAISMTRTSDRIAPDPVVFEAVASGFTLPSLPIGATEWRPAEHRLLYKWTFTTSGRSWSYFRAPLLEWNETDVRYGPKVTQMIFDPENDFTATVEVWGPNGEYATASTTIPAADIVDPDVFYAGADTVIVDPSGFGDPSRPDASVVTTLALAFAVSNRSKRILLKRGETYTATWNLYNTSGSDRFYVGAWGTGAKPVLNWTGNDRMFLLHQDSTEPPRLVDLDLRGPGDMTADLSTASITQPNEILYIQSRSPVIICGCSISQHAMVRTTNTDENTHIVLWDTCITQWWDYGMLSGVKDGRLSIVGCDISQSPDMDSGGPKFKASAGQVYANHGASRFSGYKSLYMDCVSMASHNGWFPAGDYTDIQPCLRLTELAEGASVFVSRVASDGPLTAVNTNGSINNYPLNCVFDKAIVTLTAAEGNGGASLAIERSGVTARNILIVSDNVASAQKPGEASPYGDMVRVRNQAVMSGTSKFEPIEIYGLTLVDRMETSVNALNTATIRDDGHFDNLTISGVVTHAPAKDTPLTPHAPMTEGTILSFQSDWKGFAYRPGARRYDLVNAINASQTAGIVIDTNISDRFIVESTPITYILGGNEAGEQITATGMIPNGGNYEFTGVTRGVNGTAASSQAAATQSVWSGPIARLTQYAATPNFAKVWIPAAGSSALGGANADALKPLDDIRGHLRTSVTDVDDGAFQVSS